MSSNSGGNVKAAGNTGQHDQTASRNAAIAAQQAQQAKENARLAQENQRTEVQSHGFDSSGNRLNDKGQIVQFTGQQAKESYYGSRGVDNTGKISNAELYAKSDFSSVGGGGRSFEVNFNEGVGVGDQISGGSSRPQQSSVIVSKSKSDEFFSGDSTTRNQLTEQQNINSKVDNAFTALSNKDVRQSNLKNEKDITTYFSQGNKEGVVFTFLSGEKQVGKTSGPRAFHDFLKARKETGGNISIEETFPSREQTLNKAVQKNTNFFENLPPSYWEALGKSGYVSQNNVNKINNMIDLNVKTQNRENLASLQGFVPVITESGAVSSFARVPFSGSKEYNAFIGVFGQKPMARGPARASNVRSTSVADFGQFLPGLPIIDRLSGPASKVWIDIIEKTGMKTGEVKTKIGNRVKTSIGSQAFDSSFNYANPKNKPISLEPRTSRQGPTFRNTNPTREKLPTDIFSRDVESGVSPISVRQNTPRNTLFEDISKQTQKSLQENQNNLLKPRTTDTNPSASRNLPFFMGRKNAAGRLFTSNEPPVKNNIKKTSNEAQNVSGLTFSVSPITTKTDVSTTGLSPISSEYFGVQFTGSYPTSYLPPAAGQIGSSGVKPIESDIFYRPSRKPRNIELGFGETTRESVSAKPELLGQRKNLAHENQSIFLSRTQSNLLTPSKKETIRIFEQKSLEETNPLGRRGKTAIPNKSPLDFTQTPRSEFVESGRIKPENEVFSNRGQKLKNEYGDVLFGNLGKPQGALRKAVTSTKSTKPEINLEPQKEYQDWRFEKNAVKGPFNYKFRVGKEPKEINLEPRGDYQDWRFSKFLEKNPQPEKTGESSSRLNDIFRAGQAREVREKKFAKPSQTNQDLINGNVGKFFSNENNMFSEHKINLGKGIGRLVPKSGGGEAIRKTFKKPPPPSFTRTFEEPKGKTNEVGGGLLAILKEPSTIKKATYVLRKPKVSSTQIVSVSNIQKPRSKINKIMSGYLTNLQKQRLRTEGSTKARQSQIFKPIQDQKQKNKRSSIFKSKQKQTQTSIFKPIQPPQQKAVGYSGFNIKPIQSRTPKQSPKPTQITSLIPISPNLSKPSQGFKFSFTPNNPTPQIPRNPNKPPKKILLPNFNGLPKGGNSKTKQGPTALYNLNVNNIFATGLNINLGKNRYEF